MSSIEAVYENGVFRPLQPVELPEGARVEVVTTPAALLNADPLILEPVEPLTGEDLDSLLRQIDSLPLEADPDPHLSTTYRQILYPKQGDLP